jgi:hypothetical protein
VEEAAAAATEIEEEMKIRAIGVVTAGKQREEGIRKVIMMTNRYINRVQNSTKMK